MSNLSANLTFGVIDNATKPARTIAQALEQVEKEMVSISKTMAGTGATDRLTARLSKFGASSKEVEQVAKAWRDYSASAKLSSNAGDWTRAQIADIRRWESQTISALNHVRKEEIAFAIATRKAMEQAAHPNPHGARPHAWSNHGALGYVAAAGAGAVSAHSIFSVTERGLEAGAERQHVRVGMQNAGMKPDEIGRAERSAIAASRGAPNMSVSEIMELHKEARSAVQHPDEVFALIPNLAKAASVLKGMGAVNANIADLVKAGESLGLMNDPKRFQTFLEGQVKAMNVMGKTITTEQIYEAAKYSKAAGAALSDQFINLVMPSLIQEMHGSSAGDALAMLSKTLRGGLQHKHLPVEKLNEIGMLEDPSKIRRSKTGQIMGYSGKVVGDHELANDPQAFAKIYDEHMMSHGITKLEDKIKFMMETLPSTAANVMRILIQQEETLKQHRANYEAAPGLDQAAKNQIQDASVAVKNLSSSLNDLGAAITGPGMASIGATLSSIANGVRALADVAKDHPLLALTAGGVAATGGMAGAGYLSYQLLNGFGLKTSAGLLDSAATQLMVAAGKLDASGALGTAGAGATAGAAGTAGLLSRVLTVAPWLAGLLGFDATMIGVAEAYKRAHPEKFNARQGGEEGYYRMHPEARPAGRPIPPPPPSQHWEPAKRTNGRGTVEPGHWVNDVKAKVEETKATIEQLSTVTATPMVQLQGAPATIAALQQIEGLLRSITIGAAGAMTAAGNVKIPSLGATQRGDFRTGGVQGE